MKERSVETKTIRRLNPIEDKPEHSMPEVRCSVYAPQYRYIAILLLFECVCCCCYLFTWSSFRHIVTITILVFGFGGFRSWVICHSIYFIFIMYIALHPVISICQPHYLFYSGQSRSILFLSVLFCFIPYKKSSFFLDSCTSVYV